MTGAVYGPRGGTPRGRKGAANETRLGLGFGAAAAAFMGVLCTQTEAAAVVALGWEAAAVVALGWEAAVAACGRAMATTAWEEAGRAAGKTLGAGCSNGRM